MDAFNQTFMTLWLSNFTNEFANRSKTPTNGTLSTILSVNTISALTIMIVTVIGNTTLIYTIVSKKSTRLKRVNVFLVHLAIGDLFVAFILMTTEMFFFAFGEWVLGAVTCKLNTYLQIVFLAATTFLLTAMSYDRYQVIVNPMQSLMTRPKVWKKVALAWIMAFVFATPQLFIFVQSVDATGRRQCSSSGYTHPWQRKLYFSYLTCYILLVPSVSMTYCYSRIMAVIWSRSNDKLCAINSDNTSPRISLNRKQMSESRRKAVIMSLTVILGFLSCITPYYIVSLIRIYTNYRVKLTALNEATKVILMAHSALNPFFYGFFMFKLKQLYCLVPDMCLKYCWFFRRQRADVTNTKEKQPMCARQNGLYQDVDHRHVIDRSIPLNKRIRTFSFGNESHVQTDLPVAPFCDEKTADINDSSDAHVSPKKITSSRNTKPMSLTQTETGNVIMVCDKNEYDDEVTQYVSSV